MIRTILKSAALWLAVVGVANIVMIEPLHADDRPPVRVLAAGSLRAAIGEIAAAFSAATGVAVESGFGPSGVLRERVEKGERTDLFASADMGNPLALSRAGKAGPVVLFARNQLCAFVRPGLTVTPDTLLATMLDPHIKVGTSTPKADPAGDYTWAVFARAESVRAGSRATLEGKAIRLMGGANSGPPPTGMDLFAWHLREHRADIFLAYCSAGMGFVKELPGASVVALPPLLATGADYGLTVLAPRNEDATGLALFILSQAGQAILAKNGFTAPLLTDQPR